jgi:His/Glu/Gln/Arg/opine family amino acid ABC transporter permease subunit
MDLAFESVMPSLSFLLQGAVVTLKFTVTSLFFGIVLGAILALLKLSRIKTFTVFAAVYTSVFRGTPLILQLTLVYFAIPQLIGYKITAFEAGVIAFSFNSGAYISEIIRAGITSVDRGQFEAAIALGVGYKIRMHRIIIPQAFKKILPALVNEMVDLLKESALVSVIGEMDLMRRANIVAAEKYVYFEPLIIVAAVYYVMVVAMTSLAKYVEVRMRRSD